MKKVITARNIPAILAVLGVIFLLAWLRTDITTELELRLPSADKTGQSASVEEEPIEIEGQLFTFDGIAVDLPGAWPRFRGSNFDGISSEDTRLARSWPVEGPEVVWSIDVGEGYASAAVLAGRVYVLDYDRDKQADVIRCLSFADGKDIWRYTYPVKIKRNHGMSRTIPTVTHK
jgi:outer membrane protein assembly factor BamB